LKTAVNFKTINKLAIPATIAGIAEPILSITDTAIVGNIPVDGLESLAAAGIVGSFLSMLIWVLGQTRSAISAIISQYLGAGKLEEVKTLPAQAIFLNIALSIVILLSTIFVIEDIFLLLNASGKILDYCVKYYAIRVWGFPLTLFTFAIFGIFRGLQNTYWTMLIAITGAILNIFLDFLLVYGLEGFISPMYLEGAAYASLISQGVMALMAFIFLIVKTDISLKLRFPLHPELGKLVVMSLNLFVRALALNTALILAVREAAALGDRYIGAHTIAINLWLFSSFFIDTIRHGRKYCLDHFGFCFLLSNWKTLLQRNYCFEHFLWGLLYPDIKPPNQYYCLCPRWYVQRNGRDEIFEKCVANCHFLRFCSLLIFDQIFRLGI
jgi:MATE family multidrug resistance protein